MKFGLYSSSENLNRWLLVQPKAAWMTRWNRVNVKFSGTDTLRQTGGRVMFLILILKTYAMFRWFNLCLYPEMLKLRYV